MVNERVGAGNWESSTELGDTWAARNAFSYGGWRLADVLCGMFAGSHATRILVHVAGQHDSSCWAFYEAGGSGYVVVVNGFNTMCLVPMACMRVCEHKAPLDSAQVQLAHNMCNAACTP